MRTFLVDDTVQHGDPGAMTVNGRACDLTLLAERIVNRIPGRGVIVRDVPGNRELRRLVAREPLLRLCDVVEPGHPVSTVKCAPLDRLLGAEEVAPIERAFRSVLATGQFTSGPAVEEFEHALGSFVGVDHVVGSACGTDALVGALLSVGVGPGDEVIIPPNSFPGTENAVFITGATPVLADTDDNHLLDPAAVTAAITSRTRAVLVVHLYGRFADVRGIAEVCRGLDIAVVEDAAQGIGLDGLGQWSDVAALSFNPYKNLGACGKAGAVLTNDAGIAELVRSHLYHGFEPVGSGYRKYHKTAAFGFNARIDNLQAAALLARMDFLSRNNLRRTLLASRYLKELAPLAENGFLTLPEATDNHVWHLFTVMQEPGQQNHTRQVLANHGVETDVYYPILSQQQYGATLHGEYLGADVPSATRRATEVFQLPIYPAMTIAEQDRVVEALFAAAHNAA